MGVREASGALSYMLPDGSFVGFHVDVCRRVLADVQRQLGLPRLDVAGTGRSVAEPQSRCCSTAASTSSAAPPPTAAQRQQDVAFAVTTFVEEMRFAVKADSGIGSLAQLKGKRVSTTTGTTAVQVMRRQGARRGREFPATSSARTTTTASCCCRPAAPTPS